LKSGRFDGKVVVVFGGTGSIGSEVVKAFKGSGARVYYTYLTGKEVAESLAGDNAFPTLCDIRRREQVEQFLDEVVAKAGRIDIVVNCAAILRDRNVLKMTDEEWRDVLDVNLTGAFYISRKALDIMSRGRSGRLIHFSSIVAETGNFGQVNYASTKAGIIGLTKTLAREAGKFKVTVNAIAPGFIDSKMTRKIPHDILEKQIETIPLRRMGIPTEVARIVLFLSTDEAAYITGQVIRVNGGAY
jgi:NAD(P)-dependent dehydrogenase (short-subunit alcohol dehydrogenase family)